MLAASLFALMPSHAEPVAWISGRVDSLAALFYLGAFLCFVRFRLVNRQAWLWATLLIFVGRIVCEADDRDVPVADSCFRSDRADLAAFGAPPVVCATVAARAVCRARGVVSGASLHAVRERRAREPADSCSDPGVPRPSKPLRSRTAAHSQQCVTRDEGRGRSSDHLRAGRVRTLGARSTPGLSARGSASAFLWRSVVRDHDRPDDRDVSVDEASLHHDRGCEHRAGSADFARIPAGRAPSNEDANGDGRNADRPLRGVVDLECLQLGCQRHGVTEVCLGRPSPVAVGPTWQRGVRGGARMASRRLFLVAGQRRSRCSLPSRRKICTKVQDRRATGRSTAARRINGGQPGRRP